MTSKRSRGSNLVLILASVINLVTRLFDRESDGCDVLLLVVFPALLFACLLPVIFRGGEFESL